MFDHVPHQALWLIVLILVLGLLGIVMVVLLMWSWRRHNARLRRSRQPGTTPPDAWRIAAERLTSGPEAPPDGASPLWPPDRPSPDDQGAGPHGPDDTDSPPNDAGGTDDDQDRPDQDPTRNQKLNGNDTGFPFDNDDGRRPPW